MSARLATRACRIQELKMRALLAFELASSGDPKPNGTPSPGEAASSAPSSPARSDGAATAVAGHDDPLALGRRPLNFMEEN